MARAVGHPRRREVRVGGQYVIHRDGKFWSIVPQRGGRAILGEVELREVHLAPALARAARNGWATLYVDGRWYGRELVVTELAGAVSDPPRDRPWWQRF